MITSPGGRFPRPPGGTGAGGRLAVRDGLAVRVDPTWPVVQAGVGGGRRGRGEAVVGMGVDHNWGVGGGGGGEEEAGDSQ